jgi:uncharacterized membrane protein
MSNQNTSIPAVGSNNLVAIISCFGLPGIIIAWVMFGKPEHKNALNAFHLRQNLGIMIFAVVGVIAFTILVTILAKIMGLLATLVGFAGMAFYLAIFVLWVLGLIGAIQSTQKPVPVIGEKIQSMFKNMFAI